MALRRRFIAWRERCELRRLGRLHAGAESSTALLGRPLRIVDAAGFLELYESVVVQRHYEFRAASPSPRILDCGAHVGLATVMWKRAYPHARITAFERNPRIFDALSWNVRTHRLSDVVLVPEDSTALDLRDHLCDPVDLLRIALGDAGVTAVLACAAELTNVERLLVEYRSADGTPRQLDQLLRVIARAGFRFHIVTDPRRPQQPLPVRATSRQMDPRLLIFGVRDTSGAPAGLQQRAAHVDVSHHHTPIPR
jgi:precorrin-6B methylase 2